MDRRTRWLSALGVLALGALVSSPARGDHPDPEEAPSAEPSPRPELRVDPEAGSIAAQLESELVAEGMLPAEAAARVRELVESGQLPAVDPAHVEPASLPVGGPRSAATPSALPLPRGEGSIQGLGESFSASLSTGALSFTVPIALPPGRNGVAPSLAIGYSSGGGSSELGYGWALGVPAIARQTDRGLPRYVDRPRWHPEEDRFVYAGSHELVPVDSAAMSALDGGAVPAELAGWQEYRAQVEGDFLRFFRSPDSRRWVVQARDGTRHDLGALAAGEGPAAAVSASPQALVTSPDGAHVASWALTRSTDAHGSTIYYSYASVGGDRLLTDVHYVSPAGCASGDRDARMRCAADLSQYGVRVHLVYEARPDRTLSHRTGWEIEGQRRLRRIEITAAGDDAGARTLVRRYHFAYDPRSYHSILRSITLEGRPEALDPATGAVVGDASVPEASLGDAIVGATLPPIVLRYSGDDRLARGVDGFPALDGTLHRAGSSPAYSAGDRRADLYDVNADGLVDLLVTDPVRFRTASGGPAVGVFFNGFSGARATPASAGTFSAAIPVAVDPALAGVMQLDNADIVPMDVDGDGRSDLLHMPRVASYGYFTPVRASGDAASPADQRWRFAHLDVHLPPGTLDPRIDLARDGQRIRALDVNEDGLVDVVRTSGDAIQTWLNLGFHPGGEGRFGSARLVDGVWELSPDPIESCLPAAGLPVSFDDPEVRLADMDGDGIQDIVRLGTGSLVWWPGLGHGRFGEDCAPGVARAAPIYARAPRDLGASLDTTYLADVDGDGASDLVRLTGDALDVFFNMGGRAFSRRIAIDGLPWGSDLDRFVRFVDVDGSGSLDVLFARSRGWEWVDPMGGRRPRLLVEVRNGLGAVSRFEHGSSAEDYLRDLASAAACGAGCQDAFTWQGRDDGECDLRVAEALGECLVRSTGSPIVTTVVRATETTDRLDVLGRPAQVQRTEYAYHDGFYEGIERESRGFGATDARSVGGAGQGTSITRTRMHQGRRPREIAADRLAENPYEAIKGSTYLVETRDEESGAVLSTVHTTLRIRRLAVGLDGREVSWASPSRTDEIRYDLSGAWTPAPPGARVPYLGPGGGDAYPAVVRELVGAGGAVALDASRPGWSEPVPLRSAGAYAIVASTVDEIDHAGHVIRTTAWGRIKTEWDEPLVGPEEIVSHSVPVLIDPARWVWRTAETWTSGHGSTARLRAMRQEYDPGAVDPSRTVASVTIPRSYAFDGDADGSQAFTQAAEDLVTSFTYDAWGNTVATCVGAASPDDPARCLRHATLTLDPAYAQHAVREAVAVERAGTGYRTLAWEATFDRGLGAATSARDPRGATTEIGVDGHGRTTFVRTPPVRGCEGTTTPTSVVRYEITTDPEGAPLSWLESRALVDCRDPGDAIVTRTYVDGLGRPRAMLVASEAPHAWARTGLVELTPRGLPHRTSGAAFLDVAEPSLATVLAPTGAEEWAQTGYDAFGRLRYTQPLGADHTERSWQGYGATWSYACDPFDSLPVGLHVGAGTCTYVRTDGHGRPVDTILQQRRDLTAAIEIHRLWPTYRADGALVSLERVETTDAAPRALATPVAGHRVARKLTVDSQGRRLASTDRDTDARRTGVAERNASWRYLWNRAGDLVAVRDPRGCGQNFYYDRAGRAIAEDYVRCSGLSEPWRDAPTETIPADAIALDPIGAPRRVEVRSYFDAYPAWVAGEMMPPAWAARTEGLATASTDRGGRTSIAYDARGLAAWTARQMAILPAAPAAPSTIAAALPSVTVASSATTAPRRYDELHTYVREVLADHAGRPRASALPEDPDFASGPAPLVGGRLEYDRRGLPRSIAATIDGAVHPIVASARYARDGLLEETILGDDAGGARTPTRSRITYDRRRRPDRATTTRAPSATAAPRSLAAVSVVMDQDFEWDAIDELLSIADRRPGREWAPGHRPQSVSMRYDALGHVTAADFEYSGDTGPTTIDAALDYRTEIEALESVDPMRELPAPSVARSLPSRVVSLTWDYDFLGNTIEQTDDLAAFYERSLDRITNGIDEAGGRPSALRMATSIGTGSHSFSSSIVRGGWLEVDYAEGGNVSALTVHGQCRDASAASICRDRSGAIETRRSALRAGCRCAIEQHYQYRHDELDRIVDARRYDRGGAGAWSLRAHLRYGYDAQNERTVKEVRDTLAATRYALWPFAGEFERRGLVRGTSGYAAAAGTETSYLVGGARIVWQGGTPEAGIDADHRITMPISDLLGTASAVIDLRSGELLEVSTYQPNGARETIATTDREDVPLEPYGFTGKEADEEVGLTYFGQRYLIPRLGRWATPDPLHIHAEGGGEAMNNYHYVGGNLLQARDPIGLDADADALAESMRNAGVTPPSTGVTAHHVIPVKFHASDEFFELLQSWQGVNSADNGVFLPSSTTSTAVGGHHIGGHPNYNTAIEEELRSILNDYSRSEIRAGAARARLQQLAESARAAALEHSGHLQSLSAEQWRAAFRDAPTMSVMEYAEASRAGTIRSWLAEVRGRRGGSSGAAGAAAAGARQGSRLPVARVVGSMWRAGWRPAARALMRATEVGAIAVAAVEFIQCSDWTCRGEVTANFVSMGMYDVAKEGTPIVEQHGRTIFGGIYQCVTTVGMNCH